MRVAITIDVEQDCPPTLSTYRGIEEGIPRLLRLFAEQQIAATFFCTGDVARRYPETIRTIVSEGHELGCHGDSHRSFATMDSACAREEIRTASECLRAFGPVSSFRAPFLRFPRRYLPLLTEHRYRVDSSEGRHKVPWAHVERAHLLRIPASTTSSVLRLPARLRNTMLRLLTDPVVLFVHPWEFVDFRTSDLRLDCRFRTGEVAVECLGDTIDWLRSRRGRFMTLSALSGTLR